MADSERLLWVNSSLSASYQASGWFFDVKNKVRTLAAIPPRKYHPQARAK
jgi:hypothetical protein